MNRSRGGCQTHFCHILRLKSLKVMALLSKDVGLNQVRLVLQVLIARISLPPQEHMKLSVTDKFRPTFCRAFT